MSNGLGAEWVHATRPEMRRVKRSTQPCQEFRESRALARAPDIQPHPQYSTDILVQDMGMQSAVARQSLCAADIADFICHDASVTRVTISLCSGLLRTYCALSGTRPCKEHNVDDFIFTLSS